MTKNAAAKSWQLATFGGRRYSTGEPNTGLLFPSNVSGSDTSAPYVALVFENPQNDGLPIFPANGWTYIREYTPIQQTGYYAAFWYSQNDGQFTPFTDDYPYVGLHPYPQSGNNSGTTHDWEIAGMEPGADIRTTLAGSTLEVVKGVEYVQALRITRNADGTKTARAYLDLPSTADSNIIEHTSTASYGESLATDMAIVIGDSPWFASYQHERLSGILRRQKLIAKALTEADILSEAADMSRLVTADAQNFIWWGKSHYASVDDLTCDYGTGRAPSWASATKATLWTG